MPILLECQDRRRRVGFEPRRLADHKLLAGLLPGDGDLVHLAGERGLTEHLGALERDLGIGTDIHTHLGRGTLGFVVVVPLPVGSLKGAGQLGLRARGPGAAAVYEAGAPRVGEALGSGGPTTACTIGTGDGGPLLRSALRLLRWIAHHIDPKGDPESPRTNPLRSTPCAGAWLASGDDIHQKGNGVK
jgi:hypothetical protein